uniref:SH2 domain-containing protein n=1 Tax=Syphacia muris TaxID=451379 RepID=A0A0N5ABJ8_9BILA
MEQTEVERCSNICCELPLGREKLIERDFIHYGVDRVLAENRLMRCDVGTFLVRLRHNNSLALSIRSNNRILHIKLELHNNQWILGEGPAFGSIASIIKFYRTHELPIRGADHIVLTTPVLATNSF